MLCNRMKNLKASICHETHHFTNDSASIEAQSQLRKNEKASLIGWP